MPEPQPVESETERLKLSATPPPALKGPRALGEIVNQIVKGLRASAPDTADCCTNTPRPDKSFCRTRRTSQPDRSGRAAHQEEAEE